MVRHREEVEGAQLGEIPAMSASGGDIASKRCRIAGDVGDSAWTQSSHPLHGIPSGSDARWVEDDDVASADRALAQPAVDALMMQVDRRLAVERAPGSLDCDVVGFDRIYAATRTYGFDVRAREEAHSRVEIQDVIARAWLHECSYGGDESVCCSRVDLPERRRIEGPVTTRRNLRDTRLTRSRIGEDDGLALWLHGEHLANTAPCSSEDVGARETR